MEVLLLADENLGNALEPALTRAGFAVQRASNSDTVAPQTGRLVLTTLRFAREAGHLLQSAPGTVCVLLPPGREGERTGLLAAGAAEVLTSPVKPSMVAHRLSELARGLAENAAPVSPAPESPQVATDPQPAPVDVPNDELATRLSPDATPEVALESGGAAAAGMAPNPESQEEIGASASAPAAETATEPSAGPVAATSGPTSIAPADAPESGPLSNGPAPSASLASQLFDTTSWPGPALSLEAAREALVARARGELGGNDQTGEVFRTLSEPELAALRATEPAGDHDLLIRGAAQRLVVRHVAEQAATLRREETLVEIDTAAFEAVREATSAIAIELEADVDRAVREDPGAFQRLAPARAGISRALRDLENAARLLRGAALIEDTVPLDFAIGTEQAVSRPPPRKAVATIPPEVRLPKPRKGTRNGFFIALGVVAVAVALIHLFVLGTFRSHPGDQSIPAGEIAGVPLVRDRNVLQARMAPTPDLPKKANIVGRDTREPVVFTTPNGQPIGFEVHGTFAPAPGFTSLASPPPEGKP